MEASVTVGYRQEASTWPSADAPAGGSGSPPTSEWLRAAFSRGGLRGLLEATPTLKLYVSGRRRMPSSQPTPEPPPSLSPSLDRIHGVRCYGWGARRTGRWAMIIVGRSAGRGESGRASRGWASTNQEFAYSVAKAAWLPTGKYGKPGLTSVAVGDTVALRLDTSLASAAAVPLLQLSCTPPRRARTLSARAALVTVALHVRRLPWNVLPPTSR